MVYKINLPFSICSIYFIIFLFLFFFLFSRPFHFKRTLTEHYLIQITTSDKEIPKHTIHIYIYISNNHPLSIPIIYEQYL